MQQHNYAVRKEKFAVTETENNESKLDTKKNY